MATKRTKRRTPKRANVTARRPYKRSRQTAQQQVPLRPPKSFAGTIQNASWGSDPPPQRYKAHILVKSQDGKTHEVFVRLRANKSGQVSSWSFLVGTPLNLKGTLPRMSLADAKKHVELLASEYVIHL